MKSNTILKSFFNGPLVLAISKPLFKLRFHPEITNYLIGRKEVIRKELSLIPKSPGVYRMLNHKGDILYVGKAKNLPNRLKN